MDERLGQKFGNYRLVSRLGKGGFADVYLGKHEKFSRQAAIKVLRTRFSDRDEQTFLAEANTLAQLENPHIIRILDFDFLEDGTPFLVMNYARNGTLRLRHPKGSQMGLSTLLGYVRPIGEALEYAHERNVIHRDVKSENILLDHNDVPLLSDFGIAVVFHRAPSESMLRKGGTIPYMAPEQCKGRPQFASDQYSLGVLVYEWLAGVRPFLGTEVEIYNQHLSAEPPPLHPHVPWLPSRIDQVVLRALSKDPAERYPSVLDFVEALERLEKSARAFPSSGVRRLSPERLPSGLDNAQEEDVPVVEEKPAAQKKPHRRVSPRPVPSAETMAPLSALLNELPEEKSSPDVARASVAAHTANRERPSSLVDAPESSKLVNEVIIPRPAMLIPSEISDEEAAEVRLEEVRTVRYAVEKLRQFIQWFMVVLEVVLAIRFIFKFIGADPNNIFTGFVYALTDIILYPFSGIAGSPSLGIYRAFEFSTLIAMLIYYLIFWGLRRFLTILVHTPEDSSL